LINHNNTTSSKHLKRKPGWCTAEMRHYL